MGKTWKAGLALAPGDHDAGLPRLHPSSLRIVETHPQPYVHVPSHIAAPLRKLRKVQPNMQGSASQDCIFAMIARPPRGHGRDRGLGKQGSSWSRLFSSGLSFSGILSAFVSPCVGSDDWKTRMDLLSPQRPLCVDRSAARTALASGWFCPGRAARSQSG